jgi:endonuclease G
MNKTPSRNQRKIEQSKGKKSAKRGSKGSAKHSVLYLLLTFCLAVFYLYTNRASAHQSSEATEPTETSVSSFGCSDGHSSKKSKKNKTAATTAKKSSADSSQKSKKKKNRRNSDNALYNIDYEAENLPVLPASTPSQILRRLGYTVSYNSTYLQPNWVVYELLESELDGEARRKDVDFQPDPDLGDKGPQLEDYRGSGYDRGHIAPSADFSWDATAMAETFYLSNMCPQGHEFNAGIWLYLENQVRTWAREDSAICIVAGPVLTDVGFPDKKVYIGKNGHQIVVPQYFFKVILAPFGDTPRAIGFIMPYENPADATGKSKKKKEILRRYVVTVDSVETLTGIDFFPQLPDKIEREVESRVDLEAWGL